LRDIEKAGGIMMNRKILKSVVLCCALVLIISACATARNFAGFLLNRSGKEETGKNIATFARTLRSAQGNPESHYHLARYYQDRGNHGAAIIEFEKTLAIDPGNAKAQNAMGVSYDNLKEFERASICYQAALILDPDSANIYYNNIGQSLFLQGKYQQAIEAFKKAAAYDEDFPNARVHDNLGRAYAMAGQYDLAVAEFEKGSGSASAKSFMDRVLSAQIKNPLSGTALAVATDEAMAFSTKVAKFLQEREENNIRNKNIMSARSLQKQPALAGASKATNICIEVSNGNGKDFIARDMRDSLIREGFRVARVTNGINVVRTYIYYEKGYAEEAKSLAHHMPVAAKLKEVESLEFPQVKLKLLLGKDMILHMKNPLKNPSPLNSWIGA
jgi:tetratricopeptide (TPR) repeat protein